MKFTEGYWEKNERANASYVVQVDSVEPIENGIRISMKEDFLETSVIFLRQQEQ